MNLLDEVDKNGDMSPFGDCGYRMKLIKQKEDAEREKNICFSCEEKYNKDNRTQHASQRCEPRWGVLILKVVY